MQLAGAGAEPDQAIAEGLLVVLGSTEPPPSAARPALDLLSSGPRLVECRSDETKTERAVIGAAGGTVALGGTSVVFPAGALAGPTTATVTIPASRDVEVDIETDGAKYFPAELKPIITIDYSRCTRSDVHTNPLSAWYIDSETKALLEHMEGGVDNKLPADHVRDRPLLGVRHRILAPPPAHQSEVRPAPTEVPCTKPSAARGVDLGRR